jgi:excisionase family DNA binding protein
MLVEAVREVFSNEEAEKFFEEATDPKGRIAPRGGCFLNKKQVAEWLGVTVGTLDEYMRRGLVTYYKLGRTVRFRLEDLEEHLKSTCRVAGRSSQ